MEQRDMNTNQRNLFSVLILLVIVSPGPIVWAGEEPDLTAESYGVSISDRITVSGYMSMDDSIYCINNDFEYGGIIKMGKDGLGRERIVEGMVTAFVPVKDELVYLRMTEAGLLLFRYDPVTKKEIQLFKESFFDAPVYDNNYFYFCEPHKGIYRMDRTGSNKLQICQYDIFDPWIKDGFMYGSLNIQKDWHLVRITLANKHVDILKEKTQAAPITLYGPYLFYSNESGIYRIDIKTREEKRLVSGQFFERLYIHEGLLYFSNPNAKNRIFSVTLDGSEQRVITDEEHNRIVGIDNAGIYYMHQPDTFNTTGYYLGKYYFDKQKNRELLYKNLPLQLVYAQDNTLYASIPSRGTGLWAITPGTKKLSMILDKPELHVNFVAGDFLYFTDDSLERTLFRKPLSLKADAHSLGKVHLPQLQGKEQVLYLNMQDNNTLYTMQPDGNNKTKLYDKPVSIFRADEKNIYMLVPAGENQTLLQLEVSTKKITELKTGIHNPDFPMLALADEVLYYPDTYKLIAFDTKNKTERSLADDLPSFMSNLVATKKYVYYAVDNMGIDGIYRVSQDGKEKSKVTDGEIFGFIYDKGYLYWLSDYAESREFPDRAPYTYRLKVEDPINER
jgi:hypothetical protein